MTSNIKDQFADIRILQFNVPHFESNNIKTKELVYYLSEAAICGRDILFDQHYRYNIVVRTILEEVFLQTNPDKVNSIEFEKFIIYLKRIWFSSGIHHHYSTIKFLPDFKVESFKTWFFLCDWSNWFNKNEIHTVFEKIIDIIYHPTKDVKRVSQDCIRDLLVDSANNFYYRVTQKEAEDYYNNIKQYSNIETPSFGLNSQLIKNENGIIEEVTWKLNGKYHKTIEQIIYWLSKAQKLAQNKIQKKAINELIKFYKTGDLNIFDKYNITWLQENESPIDFINGFIEVYGDPLGIKGSWEALVNIKDENATNHVKVISDNAQWFEDNSPILNEHKKTKVNGVNMKIIHAITLGGDCYPASPLGINLPNADWIREKHGSKSVSLANISDAHHNASLSSGVIDEFAFSLDEINLHKKYSTIADHLHTHLHECLGHGSGKLMPGITSEMLKAYSSVIEETRADLFGLYYIMDEKMIELGLIPSLDVAKCQYNSYIRNGLMIQLTRIEKGKEIEQAHMRNRQLICSWAYQNGNNVISKKKKNGKTFFIINDYDKLRTLFGQLLKEVQRIKSEGDFQSAMILVEKYGVKIDANIHSEVLMRYSKLNLPPFTGFLNPQLIPVKNKKGEIVDVSINYNETFFDQMLRYSRNYGFLIDESIKSFKTKFLMKTTNYNGSTIK
ncbi:MAG: dihydrofolate reductase [Marinilabiliaceae bacterium]|nr:dihydrofolate reductase [Marinilabiliaceae bacterium]